MADHNHITRDIKPRGVCPGCDLYWARHDERAAALDVTKLSRRVAHAVYALLFCDEPTYGPYTASEIVLYDPEAMSVQSTAAALREAAKLGLCMNVRGLWTPSFVAMEKKSEFEDRFLRDVYPEDYE